MKTSRPQTLDEIFYVGTAWEIGVVKKIVDEAKKWREKSSPQVRKFINEFFCVDDE